MMRRNKRGQSTLEYIIVLTVIVIAIIVAVGNLFVHGGGSGLGKLFSNSSQKIETESEYLVDYVLPDAASETPGD